MPRQRALIAEDEGITLLLLRRALEAAGYEVVGMAQEGRGAVELARSLQPDFALLDINMPGMNGIDAAREIMTERPIPIIILTAYENYMLIDAAVEAGACAYLVKPLATEALQPSLERAFELYERMEKRQEALPAI